ncbi:MAG: AMP-binding protein, partial [Chloroflexi bacterium]|nr:AMP-binding protein [Chloroflexota bacterium]
REERVDDASVHIAATTLPDDLAYIALTSGSTGAPRAILGTHRPLSHFFWWYPRTFQFVPEDRFSGLSGLGHDPFLRDIFTPLLVGARVCFPDQSNVGSTELARWMAHAGITVMHGTPSHIALLARTATFAPVDDRRRLASLRYFFSGGDLLTTQMVQSLHALAPDAHVVNLYGATETPQAIAYFNVGTQSDLTVSANAELVPLGLGIDGVQVLVLDADLNQSPPETEGEICIRTPYLATSYLNEDSLTAERFVRDPFIANSPARLYRTGDAGIAREDGVVVFRRRIGSAVKIRGFRVEPAEVERALLQCGVIRQAAVLVDQDALHETKLVAYVTACDGAEPDSESLRCQLSHVLPPYMLPATFVWLEQLPLTPSGKVDREALPRQAREVQTWRRPGADPSSATERRLARLWGELLDVADVRRDDEFLSLGGSSLLAAELFVRIEQLWGRRMPLATLFRNSSLAALAEEIDHPSNEVEWLSLVPIQPHGNRPPLYCVHGLFGDVLMFRELANALGGSQPTFGLQARGLDGVQKPIESIETMAATYKREVLAHNPEGPYQFVGFSSGGLVAYEMARQLTEEGYTVNFVGILDEPVHGAGPAQVGFDLRLVLENAAVNIPYWLESVVEMNWRQRFKLVRDRLRVSRRMTSRLLRLPQSTGVDASDGVIEHAMAEYLDFEDLAFVKSWPEFRHRLVEAHLRASASYTAPPYGGDVTVFRARRQPLMQRFEADLGWSKVVKGATEVIVVKGSHRRMVEPRYIGELASHIARRLAWRGAVAR